MKSLSILEGSSPKFIELAVSKMGVNPDKFKHFTHAQEDFLLVSEKYPIYVVADGVTLIQYILGQNDYPNPSPAGDVARIFCEEFIKTAEEKYSSFQESDMNQIFKSANEAVRKYNETHGRTKDTIDYWDTDYFAATAAFVIIKDGIAYWGSICDSYVMEFGSNGSLMFSSPKCNDLKQAESPKFSGDVSDRKAKAMHVWRTTRNTINDKGERTGYGVVTGEPDASHYLSLGSFRLQEQSIIIVCTDGFEDYMKLPEFTLLIVDWPSNLESQIKSFTHLKEEEDPEAFGHERSLIALRVE